MGSPSRKCSSKNLSISKSRGQHVNSALDRTLVSLNLQETPHGGVINYSTPVRASAYQLNARYLRWDKEIHKTRRYTCPSAGNLLRGWPKEVSLALFVPRQKWNFCVDGSHGLNPGKSELVSLSFFSKTKNEQKLKSYMVWSQES